VVLAFAVAPLFPRVAPYKAAKNRSYTEGLGAHWAGSLAANRRVVAGSLGCAQPACLRPFGAEGALADGACACGHASVAPPHPSSLPPPLLLPRAPPPTLLNPGNPAP